MTDDRLNQTIEADLAMYAFDARQKERERFKNSPEGAALLDLIADERRRAEEMQAAIGGLRRQIAEQEKRGRNHTVMLWGLVAILTLFINGYLPFW